MKFDISSAYVADQVKKMMHNMRQYQVPLQQYMAMMDLQVGHSCYSLTF